MSVANFGEIRFGTANLDRKMLLKFGFVVQLKNKPWGSARVPISAQACELSSTSLTSVTSILSAKSLTSKYCGEYHPGYYTGSDTYVYIYINKPLGSYPSYSNRGFMVGYIFYDAPKKAEEKKTVTEEPKTEKSAGKKKETSKASVLWGAIGGTTGVVAVGTLLIGIIAAVKKRPEGEGGGGHHINMCNCGGGAPAGNQANANADPDKTTP
eukprot:gene16614-18304_t